MLYTKRHHHIWYKQDLGVTTAIIRGLCRPKGHESIIQELDRAGRATRYGAVYKSTNEPSCVVQMIKLFDAKDIFH